jgi:ATP synthase subunit 6
MKLRRQIASVFLLLGLLASPVMANDEPAKNSPMASGMVKPETSKEPDENDIYLKDSTGKPLTDATGGKKVDAGKLFNNILKHSEDAYELHLISVHVELPVMFTDAFGFHFFTGMDKLEESGVYKLKNPDKYEDQKAKSQFLWVSPWERVDGKEMGFTLDLSITANRFFMLLAMLIIILITWSAGRKASRVLVPKGNQNLIESLVVYVRDEIVYPNITRKWADKLMPFFLTVFFFIFMINVLGLLPLTKTPTSRIGVTMALAVCTFILTQVMGIRTMGLGTYLKHFTGGLHEMDIPLVMKIILICIMVPIEFIGLFTKPFALTVRLFANMTAGHIVIGALIGLAILFQSVIAGFAVSVPFALFIYLLEILVAALQAFIFTILSALFVGMMVHEHHEEEHEPLIVV